MNHWIVQITSGTGPAEVHHFVGQLGEWLAKEIAEEGLSLEAVIRYGQPQAPRTVQLQVSGDAAQLADKLGTYVLVARSETRRRHKRKRWFPGVELFAYERLKWASSVDAADVSITTARAGGPGGQHVNRTESAVRAVHLPTNISVRVTAERSQHANRKRALALLGQALAERRLQHRIDAQRERRQHHHQLVRGRAIRAFRHDRRGRLVERAIVS